MNFRKWFKTYLKDYTSDIANYGCDKGFPYITYSSDAAKVYDLYSNEIWENLRQDAEDFGNKNVMEMLSQFNRSDMIEEYLNTGTLDDSAKTLLAWYMCEKIAHEIEV